MHHALCVIKACPARPVAPGDGTGVKYSVLSHLTGAICGSIGILLRLSTEKGQPDYFKI